MKKKKKKTKKKWMHCDVSVTFDPRTPDGRHTIIIIGLNGM